MSFSVTPQISGESDPDLEPDADSEVAGGDRIGHGRARRGRRDARLSGFTRDREIKERKAVGVSGGWFGRGTVVTHKRVELVILLTAKIVAGVSAQ